MRPRCGGASWQLWLLVVFAAMCAACRSPAERTVAIAVEHGANVAELTGDGYRHVVIDHPSHSDAATIHFYFSGDGTPWLHHTRVAADPTPRDPLELELMFEDAARSFYVGRPCYVGLAAAPGCSPALWTDARYSAAVVASMTAVVQQVLDGSQARHAVIIGYSGGGVLAVLVAERVPRIDTVVTIGANLDIDAWAAVHGYTPLTGSLNPANVFGGRAGLRQIHLVGARDTNVPPQIAERFGAGRRDTEVRVIPGFDHHCCWVAAWPDLLQSFEPNEG